MTTPAHSLHTPFAVARGSLQRALAAGFVAALAAAPSFAQQPSLGASPELNAAAFRNQIGRHITYVCPATNIPPGESVWGTDIYTFDSAVCIAAIHAGVLQRQRVGVVTFVMGPGAKAFVGSARNGVTSGSYAAYDSTFSFDKSGEPGRIDGATTLRVPTGFVTPLLVVCPPTGDFPYDLWGTDIYADDSSVCAAAVHAGVITAATGGQVTVTPGGKQTTFQGSTRNGVLSQNYTEWPTSFRVAAAAQTPALATAGAIASGPRSVTVEPAAAEPVTAVLATAPAATGMVTAALPANAGRYRVVLTGAQVLLPTKDIRDNADGIGDEIYGAAVTMLWDRRSNIITKREMVRTVEYGDTNAIRKADNRVRAGTGGTAGGLVRGNVVPTGFVPGQMQGDAQSDRFPLLVWDGVLTDGIDGLLVVPSLWEKDAVQPKAYESAWLTGEPVSTLAFVVPQLAVQGIRSIESPAVAPGVPTVFALTDLIAHIADRPIGLTPQPFVVPYNDRFVVITREKLGLASGGSTSVQINLSEPDGDPVLGGTYTLFLRIERTQ